MLTSDGFEFSLKSAKVVRQLSDWNLPQIAAIGGGEFLPDLPALGAGADRQEEVDRGDLLAHRVWDLPVGIYIKDISSSSVIHVHLPRLVVRAPPCIRSSGQGCQDEQEKEAGEQLHAASSQASPPLWLYLAGLLSYVGAYQRKSLVD